MRQAITGALLATAAMSAGATATEPPPPPPAAVPLAEGMLAALRWQARPVVVLGPAPAVAAQLAALTAAAPALAERDVVLLTDGAGAAPLRARVGDGFAVILIGKDGGVKWSAAAPVPAAAILGRIDAMPMRRREAAGRDRGVMP